MKEEKLEIVESFVEDFEDVIKRLEKYSGYLNLPEKAEGLRTEALEILNKKLKKIKKSKDEDDLKKHLKVKKIIEKDGKHL
jgi:ADP-dependent phosphofructokinase/glucokinase